LSVCGGYRKLGCKFGCKFAVTETFGDRLSRVALGRARAFAKGVVLASVRDGGCAVVRVSFAGGECDGCSAVGFACACCEGREAARSHVRCRRHLRARAAAQPVQGVWRRRHLRARSAAQPVQGVRRRRHKANPRTARPRPRARARPARRGRGRARGPPARGTRRAGRKKKSFDVRECRIFYISVHICSNGVY